MGEGFIDYGRMCLTTSKGLSQEDNPIIGDGIDCP